MPSTSFQLFAEIVNQDYSYIVTVDELFNDVARINIAVENNSKKTDKKSQGVDLTGEECKALGNHLIAIAERLKRETHE